jgi:hypothetical protein
MKPFAFVFPGQGSQSVGMLDAWGDHSVVRAVLDEASQALQEDIGALIREGSKEALALTTNTQPVMLVAGSNQFTWSYPQLQGIGDESWGLDNVTLTGPDGGTTVVPVPGAALLLATPAAAQTLPSNWNMEGGSAHPQLAASGAGTKAP